MELPKDFIANLNMPQSDKTVLEVNLNTPPFISLRVNANKVNNGFEGSVKIPWAEQGLFLNKRPSYIADPLFHAGSYYPQEAASMFLEQFLKQVDLDGSTVLDLCAAPGGKSTHIASLLPDSALLVANEIIRQRAWILKENLDKWGSSNVIVTNNEPKDFKEFLGAFDVVLVDAPCSGEGMFRKDLNARGEWSLKNVEVCYQRQQDILDNIIPTVKDGGVLIYSTCTFNDQENRDNLKWIQEHYNIEPIALNEMPDGVLKRVNYAAISGHEATDEIIEITEGELTGYQFIPGIARGEGYFISAMRILGGRTKLKLPKRIRKVRLDNFKEETPFFNSTYKNYTINDEVYHFPEAFEDFLRCAIWDLKPLKMGTQIGQYIQGKWKYSYELALAQKLNASFFEQVELSLEDAQRFLQKNPIEVQPNIKSWGLVTYKKQPLGWLKKINNRYNNYYPKEYRIRKENLSEG